MLDCRYPFLCFWGISSITVRTCTVLGSWLRNTQLRRGKARLHAHTQTYTQALHSNTSRTSSLVPYWKCSLHCWAAYKYISLCFGRLHTHIPYPPLLILTLFSERESAAMARCSSLVISCREYLQAQMGSVTELRLSRNWQSKDRHRRQIWDGLFAQRKEGAACQDENINDTQPERDTERWTSCKIHCSSLEKY